jgi:hypothetical protein
MVESAAGTAAEAANTWKVVALVAEPAAAVTVIFPVVAPKGTVAVIWVELFSVNVAAVPLKATAEAPSNFVPVIETDLPTAPVTGDNPVIVTVPPGGETVKFVALVAVPPRVVTVILPVVAAAGTVAVILVGELRVKVAATPLNLTEDVLLKVVPLMVTLVPGGPEPGEKLVMMGRTRKVAGL